MKFVDNHHLRHFLYCNQYFSPNQSEVIYLLLPFVGFEGFFSLDIEFKYPSLSSLTESSARQLGTWKWTFYRNILCELFSVVCRKLYQFMHYFHTLCKFVYMRLICFVFKDTDDGTTCYKNSHRLILLCKCCKCFRKFFLVLFSNKINHRSVPALLQHYSSWAPVKQKTLAFLLFNYCRACPK